MAGTVSGELGGQPVFLENAATEATLEALLQATLANSPNKGKAAQIQKAYEEAVKRSTDRQQTSNDALKRQAELIAKEEKQRQDLNKQMQEEKEAREKLFNGLNELGALVGKGLGVAFGTATPKVNDFTNALSGIPILGPIIGALGNALQGSIDNFRTLSTVGADFGVGVNGVRLEAAKAGLSLETFTKTISENSGNLALLGGNASTGAKIFQKVNASLQGPFQEGLARLGFSMEETAEYTAGYLAMQTKLGKAQRMSQDELNEGAQNYLLELDRLARVTGMSRAEAQKALDAQLQDKRMKALSMSLGAFGEELNSTITGISSKNKDVADGLKDLMVTNGAPITEMGKSIALNNPELARAAVAYKNQRITGAEFEKTLRAAGRVSNDRMRAEGGQLALYSHLGSGINNAVFELGVFEKYAEKASETLTEQEKAMKNQSNTLANLDKRLLDLRNTVMAAIAPALERFATLLTNNIPLIQSFATTIVNGIETFMKNMSDPNKGFVGAVVESLKGIGAVVGPVIADTLKEAFISLFMSNPVITSLVVAITALFAASKVKGAVDTLRGGPGAPGAEPGKGGGKGGKLLSGVKGLGIGTVASIGGNLISGAAQDAGHTKTAAWADMASTTAGMAGTGALVGSVIPGVGTAIGGAVGGAVGAGMGIYQNWGNFFGGGDKKSSAPASGDTQTAAMVAQSITSEEVKAIAAALKDLDYTKLAIKPEVLATLDSGTLKMRQLRGEVNAMTTSFKALDNTGLDKITKGISSLSDEFEKFNKKFSIDFMEVFKKLYKESQATLLSQLNEKMDELNTSTLRLIEVQEEVSDNTKSMANKTGTNMAKK
jgi:hypothetical protein